MTVTVGAYLRVDPEREAEVRTALDSLDGVEALEVEGEGKLGALIEAADLDQAHALLTSRVQRVPGVLAAWPVYADLGEE